MNLLTFHSFPFAWSWAVGCATVPSVECALTVPLQAWSWSAPWRSALCESVVHAWNQLFYARSSSLPWSPCHSETTLLLRVAADLRLMRTLAPGGFSHTLLEVIAVPFSLSLSSALCIMLVVMMSSKEHKTSRFVPLMLILSIILSLAFLCVFRTPFPA